LCGIINIKLHGSTKAFAILLTEGMEEGWNQQISENPVTPLPQEKVNGIIKNTLE